MVTANNQRWTALCGRLGAKGDFQGFFDDLINRYAELHRAYHTIGHVGSCLEYLDQVRSLAKNPDALELALWYHDAVYDTKAKDNEEQSAALAQEMIKNSSLPESLGQEVADFILATKHSKIPADSDARLLIDIDLSILGQSDGEFDRYEQQIRKEYEWVSEKEFVAGRSAILKSFLDRPNIYMTEFFRNKYEAQARRNISRSLSDLSR